MGITVSDACPHTHVTDSRCRDCGVCLHRVILNGVCYDCGERDVEATIKPASDIVPVGRLKKRTTD